MTTKQQIEELALEMFNKAVTVTIEGNLITVEIETQVGTVSASAVYSDQVMQDSGPTTRIFIAKNVLHRLYGEIIAATL